jgi:hypothetical protein
MVMQYLFSCMPNTFVGVESTISAIRISRYLVEAKGNHQRALRLYVWNAAICEAFYFPSQIVEVAIRNRLHHSLANKFGPDWYASSAFFSPLPNRLKNELEAAIRKCQRDHGPQLTINHIIAAMSLGFWCHILTSWFESQLWQDGLQEAFPHIPTDISRQQAYDKIDQFRHWRNRIAHHGAVFDKSPMKELKNMEEVLSWICPETLWFMRQFNDVQKAIGRKPVRS